jgi:hypothetical protein
MLSVGQAFSNSINVIHRKSIYLPIGLNEFKKKTLENQNVVHLQNSHGKQFEEKNKNPHHSY